MNLTREEPFSDDDGPDGPDGADSADAEENQQAASPSEEPEPAAESTDPDFVPWDESNFKQVPSSKVAHRKIILSRLVSEDVRKVIVPQMPDNLDEDSEEADITPIMEGDQITGVRVECPCGRVHEVRFEFDS